MNVYALIPMIVCVAFCCAALFFVRKSPAQHMCLCTVILTLLVSIFLLRNFLLGKSLYLFAVGDGTAQYLPQFTNFVRIFQSEGMPLWDFSTGFGAAQDYRLALYPLNLIPILSGVCFGEQALCISFAWMQAFKMVLAALFMFLFLRKLELDPLACSILSLIYALCGVITLRGHWINLGDECYLAAMILWGAECYFRERKWYFIPPAIFLLGSCLSLYYLYLYALLLIIYGTIRYFFAKRPARQYPRFVLACGGLYLLGASMAAVLMFGFDWTLFTAARFSSTLQQPGLSSPLEHINRATLLSGTFSLFDTNALGVFDRYSGTLNYLERPLLYVGICCLYLLPQGFLMGQKRVKKLMALGLVIAGLYLLFPVVTDIFNAGIYNSELGARSYRYSSLWIIVMMLVMAAYGLHCVIQVRKFHTAGLLSSAVIYGGLFLLCYVAAPKFDMTPDHSVVAWCWLFLIGWPILFGICHFFNRRYSMTRYLAIVLCFALLEMGHSAAVTYYRSSESAADAYSAMETDPMGFYGDISAAVARIQELDSGFYRISGINTYTDGAVFCAPLYFGAYSSSYYANIDANTYYFLNEVYPESFPNSSGDKYSFGVGSNLELSTLTGYSYHLIPVEDASEVPFGYEYIDTVGNIKIFKNTNRLSLGITYDTYVKRSVFEQYTDPEQRLILLGNVVLDDNCSTSLRELTKAELDQVLTNADGTDALSNPLPLYTTYAAQRQTDMLEITQWSADHILGTVSAETDRYLTFSIPNVPGWQLIIDGEPTELQSANIGFIGAEISAGSHTVELLYRPWALVPSTIISVCAALIFLVCLLFRWRLIQPLRLHR